MKIGVIVLIFALTVANSYQKYEISALHVLISYAETVSSSFGSMLIIAHNDEFKEVVEDYSALIGPIKAACIDESKANSDLVDKLLINGEYVEDRPVKCYLRCLYLKLQMLNEAGEINEENVKKNVGVLDKDIQEKVYQKCKSVTGDDLCEKAFNLSKCTYTTVKGSTS